MYKIYLTPLISAQIHLKSLYHQKLILVLLHQILKTPYFSCSLELLTSMHLQLSSAFHTGKFAQHPHK